MRALVFQHIACEPPGAFAEVMRERRWTTVTCEIDETGSVPHWDEFDAIVAMGGPMSANDELAWTRPVLELMRDARRRGVPMIGHCLGAQMMSRALGGEVRANPVKEIGWNPVKVEDTPLARKWFGDDLREFTTFQWHGETFSIPPGGERILTGMYCPNQAYVVDGRHLGLQCHVEMTPEMIASWLASGRGEIEANLKSPAVQPAQAIRGDMPRRLPDLSANAERLYRRWITNLKT